MADIQFFNLNMQFQKDFDSFVEEYMPVGKKKGNLIQETFQVCQQKLN